MGMMAPRRALLHTVPARRFAAAAPLQPAQYALLKWVDSYRQNGHLFADINPLKNVKKEQHDRSILDPASYGLSGSDSFPLSGVVSLPSGASSATVDELREHLEATYCASLGAETQHVATEAERQWLNEYLESRPVRDAFSTAEKRNIYSLLVQSEFFDQFMGKKFTSFKRYGLEGAESALVALEEMLVQANRSGYEKVVLGMPHRGRLNMLVSLLDLPARALFAKVKGQTLVPEGMDCWDDVASHLAVTTSKKFDRQAKENLTVSLLHNPSHLEAVNPVALGKAKAKQDDYPSHAEGVEKVLSLQLHGDSAYAGQGIVPESLQMAYLNEFSVGGTVHMIVNNQLGFTTGGVGRNRSSRYSSDIGKIISMPVLHVNADAPESVAYAARLALAFQRRFHRDIMVDLIGYRKHGHNEVDEPSFTQPRMYQDIRSRSNIVKLYREALTKAGVFAEGTDPDAKLIARIGAHLEKELAAAPEYRPTAQEHYQGKWQGIGQPKDVEDVVDSGVEVDTLKKIGEDSVKMPEGFNLHPRLKRGHVDARLSALASSKPAIDWATAECMAYGSLVRQGYNLRLCGQDVERGTFSQRHHVLTDQQTDETLMPLRETAGPSDGRFQTINSHLSELAVLGFEYGYSWENPRNFNVWEAQFGDFNNGAQIVLDTFVASGESKWLRSSGLTILLPHGYDGAGPEHSSSRVERFLQMTDDWHDLPRSQALTVNGGGAPRGNSVNMIIANPTTPANYFHLLRRQMLRTYRKPLVVVTPKTLLRHPDAVSSLSEMAPGSSFQPVLDDAVTDPKKVKSVVLLSGKLYYELCAKRVELKRVESSDVAFVRLEELCPFPAAGLAQTLARYPNASKLFWAQEEPSNMGAWAYVAPRLTRVLQDSADSRLQKLAGSVEYIGRAALPSPAVGAAVYHKKEVEKLFKDIFERTQ